MPDSLADRVRTIVASAAKLPPAHVRLDSGFEELGIAWLDRIQISFDLEKALGLPFDTIDDETEGAWTSVADVVTTAERLMHPPPIAGTPSGRAA